MAMQLIETIEVGAGGAASIEFTSIPQDGVDLLLVLSARNSDTGVPVYLQLNNDTGSNYNYIRFFGTGSSVITSSISGTELLAGFVPSPTYTANTFGNSEVYFSNYTSSVSKTVSTDSVSENNATLAYGLMAAGNWSGTAAISSIKLFASAAHLMVQYSTASLYKIS